MTIDITVNVYLANSQEVRSLKHSLAHLTCLATEILQATVTDPAKFQELIDKLNRSGEALQSAVDASQPRKE